jgi:peptide/nickel transport system permease protein
LAGPRWTAYITTEHPTQGQINIIIDKYHLNEDPLHQYYYWLDGIVHGDWGWSKAAREPVTTAIVDKFPATFELTMTSMIIALLVGIELGTFSAVRRNRPSDHITRFMALSGVSLPIFWLGLILLSIFYLYLGVAPPGGRIDDYFITQSPVVNVTGFYTIDTILMGRTDMLLNVLWHLALPAITLAFGTIAILTRIMRSSMLEVLNQDYIRTARSKGLPEKQVIRKHARRNALIPTTTVSGMAFGGLLGGAVLTETIFSWPGLGQWSTRAIVTNDPAAIMGFSLLVAIIYVLSNLIVDIMYVYLDPRVNLE